jgi:Phospholipase_D-nuclease N-terminal
MLATTTFGEILWSMLIFFFWFMAIWIFITVFADIFRRRDIGGGAKAGWILLIFIVPFFGALIYIIARPSIAVGEGRGEYYAGANDAGGTREGPRMS